MPPRPVQARRTVAVLLLAGFQGGGAERVVAQMFRQPQAGIRMVLITNRGADHDRYSLDVKIERVTLDVNLDETQLFAAGILRSLPRVVRLLRRTRAALTAIRADTVVAFLTSANLLAIIAAKTVGAKVIVSERSDTTREYQPLPIRAARRALYRFADVVTANSQGSVNDLQRYVLANKVVFVPNPVRLPNRRADPKTARTVLCVGRLVEEKDPSAAVRGFAASGAAQQGWTLAMVGDGPLRDDIRDLAAESGVGDRVQLPGFIDDPTDCYLAAGVFVLTSRYEGTPNALLEAMAAGVPCIVSDGLAGALAVVENDVSGLVYREGDVNDLGDQIRTLVEDEQLRVRLGAEARTRMRAFDPSVVADIWHKLIER